MWRDDGQLMQGDIEWEESDWSGGLWIKELAWIMNVAYASPVHGSILLHLFT